MTPIRDQYLRAAAHAAEAIAGPEVAERWTEPSALEGFTVGGLAVHYGQQVTSAAAALDADAAGKEVVGLYGHYERAPWLAADIDSDYNTMIRAAAEQTAADRGIVADARAALADLAERLPALPDGHIAGNPRWPYATLLDDFLITRLMEIVVHDDDLNASLGREGADFDQDVFDTAAAVLTRLAAKRHGQTALVRALARAERAPASISGL